MIITHIKYSPGESLFHDSPIQLMFYESVFEYEGKYIFWNWGESISEELFLEHRDWMRSKDYDDESWYVVSNNLSCKKYSNFKNIPIMSTLTAAVNLRKQNFPYDDERWFEITHRPKKFDGVCFNNKIGEHSYRRTLIEKLMESKLLGAPRIQTSFNDVINGKGPVSIDDYKFHGGEGHDISTDYTPSTLIEDSYFCVVTETDIVNDGVMQITEKTWKHIVTTPCLILGRPNLLLTLRSLGYKTFPMMFDESYDGITDREFKFECIIKELKKFVSLETKDKKARYQNAMRNVKFNQQKLIQDCGFGKLDNIYFDTEEIDEMTMYHIVKQYIVNNTEWCTDGFY